MNILVDIILVLLLVLPCIFGARKGVVKMARHLVCLVGAIIIAIIFYKTLGDVFNRGTIGEHIRSFVTETITSTADEDGGLEKVFEENTGSLQNILSIFGADSEAVKKACVDAAESAENTITHMVAEPLSEKISYALAFLALYVGGSLVLLIIMILLNQVFKLPGLKTANRILGFCIGLIVGCVTVYVLANVFVQAVPYLGGRFPDQFPDTFVDKTFVLKLISNLKISDLFQLVS